MKNFPFVWPVPILILIISWTNLLQAQGVQVQSAKNQTCQIRINQGHSGQDRQIGNKHCQTCHPDFLPILSGPMAHRNKERAFWRQCQTALDKTTKSNNWTNFSSLSSKTCQDCHLSSCSDCHLEKSEKIGLPRNKDCLTCHQGYFTGPEYLGLAPREDTPRYQRGKTSARGLNVTHYLQMQPDIHFKKGLSCGDCHSMASLAEGKKSSRTCVDCHQPDERIIAHRIKKHREKLECIACHSAWLSQEYGTFYITLEGKERTIQPTLSWLKARAKLVSKSPQTWIFKSSYLKKQDLPPLGVNQQGRLQPMRPQFILYWTRIKNKHIILENRLLAKQWKIVFPHTVSRSGASCEQCHNYPQRFLAETQNKGQQSDQQLFIKGMEKVYLPLQDGLCALWSQKGCILKGGKFFQAKKFFNIIHQQKYIQYSVQQWQKLIKRAASGGRQSFP